MLIIGHRGAAGLEPENTIGSLKKAEECDVAMIEMDLRLRKDGKIILCHDHDSKKVYPDAPELTQALACVNRPVNLDVKESGFEAQLLENIKEFAHKVLITSWNPIVLKKIRTLDGNVALGPIVGSEYGFLLPIVVAFLKNTSIDSITIGSTLVTPRRMKSFNKLGWKVYPFTVNEPKEFEQLKNLGVEGMFTDYPNILSKLV